MRKNLVLIGVILIVVGIALFFVAEREIVSSSISNSVVLQSGKAYEIPVSSTSVFVYKDNYSVNLNLTGFGVTVTPVGTSNGAMEYELVVSSSPHYVLIEDNYSSPVQVTYVVASISGAGLYAGVVVVAVILFIAGLAVAIYGAIKK